MAYFPQGVAPSVSSALARFTAVFGKGTGGTAPLKLPEDIGYYNILFRVWKGLKVGLLG